MVEGRYTLFRACSIPILTRSREKNKRFFLPFPKNNEIRSTTIAASHN